LFQPEVNTVAVKLVAALKSLDHLATLQIIEADGARVFVRGLVLATLLVFLELETGDCVDDVLDFFC